MKTPNVGQDSKVLLRHPFYCVEPLSRPNYFNGRLLTEQDFIAEQNYLRDKQRQHNLHCHGIGVVNGLKVSATNQKTGSTVTIEAGVAIDPRGNEVHLCTPASFPLPPSPIRLQVGIRFSERFTGSAPAGMSGESTTMPAQIEEGCEIILETLPLAPGASATHCPSASGADVLPLARLVRRGRQWQLHRRFKVARSH